MIREKFGFERWMIVGGSWGATLALAYAAGASRPRQRHRAARHLSRHARRKSKTRFLDVLPRFYPGLYEDFLSVLPPEERAQPLDAYFRRILDSDSAVHIPAARAWDDTERILSEHAPNRVRLDLPAQFVARPARDAVHGSALFCQ